MHRLPLFAALVALGSCSYTGGGSYVGILYETTTCTDATRNTSSSFKRMIEVDDQREHFSLYDSTSALLGPVLASGTMKHDHDVATINGGSGFRNGGTVPYTVREGTVRFDSDEVTVRIVVEAHPDSPEACTTVSEGTLPEEAWHD